MNIQDHIRIVPNFPKDGINFYDIASLIAHPEAWRHTIISMQKLIEKEKPTMLMGIEARGFLVAAPLAMEMDIGFGMVRKKGKLPGTTISHSYSLEYGEDEIEIQPDMVPAGARVVLVDDLLATGGTMSAAEALIAKTGAHVVMNAVIIELEGLNGVDKLKSPLQALIKAPA